MDIYLNINITLYRLSFLFFSIFSHSIHQNAKKKKEKKRKKEKEKKIQHTQKTSLSGKGIVLMLYILNKKLMKIHNLFHFTILCSHTLQTTNSTS